MLLIDPLFEVSLYLFLGLVLVAFAGQVTFAQSKRLNFMLLYFTTVILRTYINQVEIFLFV